MIDSMTCVARVLVVDNDPQTCHDLHDLLAPHGYEVYTVAGGEGDIVAVALDVARQRRPHVVVIDLRLQDDYLDEYSGLDILHRIRPAHAILYSAYLTADAIHEARELLYDWVRKHDAAVVLRNTLRKAAAEKSAVASGIEVHWPVDVDPATLACAIADAALPTPPAATLDDVVVQLCPQARQVRLQPLRRTQSAPSGASRTRSAVFLLQQDDRQPAVLKFGRSQQIQVEQANYRQYIQQRFPGPYSAQPMSAVEFWDIGGVTYTFVGTGVESLPTFSDFYHRTQEPAAILAPLRFFFEDVWGAYYRAVEPLAEHSLFEAYDRLFGLRKQEQGLRTLYNSLFHAGVVTHNHNPSTWMLRHAEESRLPNLRQAVTHGDLHGDNLFVDGERAWVIDFERAGPGHILRDFAELEVDILTRLLSWETVDEAAVSALAARLYQGLTQDQIEPLSLPAAEPPDVHKAHAVVTGLRQIARKVTDFEPVEYGWSVLADALFAASITQAPPAQRRRAMIVSTLVCECLQQR